MAKRDQSQTVPRVYSYIRFSTPEQKQGASDQRQLDRAEAWAKRNGYGALDKKLRRTDEGRSGYHGTHRKKGVLGAFLREVDKERVPRGSVLLVENIDRLSREGVASTLREIIFKLFDRGIVLQTLSPEETYQPGCEESPKFVALMLYIQRAHEESKRKGELVRDARERERSAARDKKQAMSRMCPAWLSVTEDRRFEVNKDAAKAIRMIFNWRKNHDGVKTIAKRLNANGAWKPPKIRKTQKTTGWRHSYVSKILDSRAVIGEFQPHELKGGRGSKRIPIGDVIPDYFPAIIELDDFNAVQEKRAQTKGRGGRTGKRLNLFTGLLQCPYCGGRVNYEPRGAREKPKFVCHDEREGRSLGCRNRVPYDECEQLILDNCHKLKPEQVLPSQNEQDQICLSLSERIQGAVRERREAGEQIKNLTDQISSTKKQAARDLYEARLVDLLEQKEKLDSQIKQDETELAKAEASRQDFTKWQRDLESLKRELAKNGNLELRERLQSHLREFIERIEVFGRGHKKLFDVDEADRTMKELRADGFEGFDLSRHPRMIEAEDGEAFAEREEDCFAEYNPGFRFDPQFRRFITATRMSRKGRFIRVRFKTGLFIDLVPEGSFADSFKMVAKKGGKWYVQRKEADIEQLWQLFERSRPKVCNAR